MRDFYQYRVWRGVVRYNPISTTSPDGAWTCTPNGNSGTPGVQCTGYYNVTAHLDTSYLITPLLDLSSYASHRIFLRFDTKTTKINNRARLSVIAAEQPDSNFNNSSKETDLTPSMMPIISMGDSSGWVTHQVELTSMEIMGPIYLAFRYVSATDAVSTWYLDNINTSTIGLNVPETAGGVLPLTIIGNSTRNNISFAFNPQNPDKYDLAIYDMIGRMVHQEVLSISAGSGSHAISGLNLNPGMYCLRINGEQYHGIAKVMIP
jgi:hypothetical protein